MLGVTGGKGGVGKTTTALGLARAVARETGVAADGRDVVVVDADRDLPDLARMAGVAVERATAQSLDDSAGARDPVVPSVRLVTAPRDGTEARRLLDALARRPERVVVDCPAGAGRGAAVPLVHTSHALVVSTPAPASLRDGAKAAAMARRLDARPVASLLTRCDRPTALVERLLPTPAIALPRLEDPLGGRVAVERYRNLSERATLRNG
jgi:septum site-determining protein MinD